MLLLLWLPVLQSCYAAIATTLEALLLIGLSSHISKLLLIYTELMRVGNLNYAVVGVTTGKGEQRGASEECQAATRPNSERHF